MNTQLDISLVRLKRAKHHVPSRRLLPVNILCILIRVYSQTIRVFPLFSTLFHDIFCWGEGAACTSLRRQVAISPHRLLMGVHCCPFVVSLAFALRPFEVFFGVYQRPRFAQRTSIAGQQTCGGLGQPIPWFIEFVTSNLALRTFDLSKSFAFVRKRSRTFAGFSAPPSPHRRPIRKSKI